MKLGLKMYVGTIWIVGIILLAMIQVMELLNKNNTIFLFVHVIYKYYAKRKDYYTYWLLYIFYKPPHSEFFSCRNTFIPTADEQQMYSTYKLHQ